jgi:hypothetical protein
MIDPTMDAKEIQAVLEGLAALPAGQQKALAGLVLELKGEASAHPANEAPAVELPVNLSITVIPASKESLTRVAADPQAAGALPVSVPPETLSKALLAAIEKAQPAVLKALEDPHRAALFAADPRAALQQISGQLDPAFLKLITAAHAKASAPPAAPGVRLRSVTVGVKA